MKIVLFLFLLYSFSNSEYLMTLEQSNNNGTLISCIKDYSYSQNQINYIGLDDISYSLNTELYQSIDIKHGYKNNNGYCFIDKSLLFGFDYEQFNFLMAVYGIFLSSLISFGLIKAF